MSKREVKSGHESQIGFYTLTDGLTVSCDVTVTLARSQYVPGRPSGRPLQPRFSWFSICIQANTEIVPKFQVATALLIQPSRLKFIKLNPPAVEAPKLPSQIIKLAVNHKIKISWPLSTLFYKTYCLNVN